LHLVGSMLVVFEGIDGSGKTTLSNRAAAKLRTLGLDVKHVRSEGRLASRVAEGIREFTRDQRNLELAPYAEFLLNAAREAQQLDEAIRPALAAHDVVIADRFLYTPENLAHYGRGLPRERLLPVLEAVAHGCSPDLVVLVTVDPQVALARRRGEKVVKPSSKAGSRKGLSGTGLAHRLHDGYLEMARQDPGRWLVIHNTDADLDAVVDAIVAAIRVAAASPEAPAEAARQVLAVERLRTSQAAPPPATDPDVARDQFIGWIDRQEEREPALAAYMLSGLAGEGIDERRIRLAARCPELIAYGLTGLDDDVSWQLRYHLADAAPRQVARSLDDLPPEHREAWALRETLVATVAGDVVASLDARTLRSPRDDARAWSLRERVFPLAPDAVMGSLAFDDSARAWALRERWLELRGGDAVFASPELAKVVCASVRGLAEERAWHVREQARAAAPVPALASLEGVTDDRSWQWREEFAPHAPRPVMRSLDGVDHPTAWKLREAAAPRCKEAIDSIVGMDEPEAWALRERYLELWPSTVAKSLGAIGLTPRGRQMLEVLLRANPGNLSLLKHATAISLAEAAANPSAIDRAHSAGATATYR
jgi:dTMP kinase